MIDGFTGIALPPIIGLIDEAPSTRYMASSERPPLRCNFPPSSVTPGSVFTTSSTVATAKFVIMLPSIYCFDEVSVFSIAGRSAVTCTPVI